MRAPDALDSARVLALALLVAGAASILVWRGVPPAVAGAVQQLQMKVEKQLEDMSKLAAQLNDLAKSIDARANVATNNALKALQFEEKMMSERLAELRLLIEELKKK